MARMRDARFKRSRSLGLNVYGHPKAMNRQVPGQDRSQKKLSAYGRQLLEKQRLRYYYQVMEKQFKTYVKKAMKSQETTGPALVQALEMRLDNMVYRMGFARTLRQARQMVVHGHMEVNGKKVDRPSFALQVGDKVSLRLKSQAMSLFRDNLESRPDYPYLERSGDYQVTLSRLPERQEVPIEIDDHLVVEYYSKAM